MWIDSQHSGAVTEQIFHDRWAERIDPATVLVDESFESCTAAEGRQIVAWLGDVRGKILLDLGCGAGEAAVYFAKKGAQVTAADVSLQMLRVAKQVARQHGVHIATHHCSAERTGLTSQSFDIVYAANLLHHADVDRTLAEVKQLLKPGGVAVFYDPLSHNPLINIYRKIARQVRTDDERPLSIYHLRKRLKTLSRA